MTTDTSEKAFQNDIICSLVQNGYYKSNSTHYNRALSLDPALTLKFIQNTQPKQWNRYKSFYGEEVEKKFFFRLNNELNKKGTIYILRNGFKDVGCNFQLFYPQPNNNLNPDLFEKYENNIFAVIDELEYEQCENSKRVDLVIFINGIPVITIELKDTFSQGVEIARDQYKYDRDPREKIFQYCLVHFAVSDEKIMMSTKLRGGDTEFLPFNKDIDNPVVPDDYKTSYLYREILKIENLAKLISHFIYMEKDERSGETKPIFPRYHQWDCVNKLLQDALPGRNYLIEHSAGSGKSKTIAWLAHGLIKKFDKLDQRIYDMVIVVSDRKVIDKQLQEQVQAIERRKGVVDNIDKRSSQLREAMKTGSNIIVSTIQKFPYILEEVKELPNRKYAVIIDEAHSSQSGTLSRKMRQILTNQSLDEAERIEEEEMEEADEELLNEIRAYQNLNNLSFFAFTATPKGKTLEMFGTKNEQGEFYPFHCYSMKQAIQEGFILDVLQNYLTYKTYFKLVKQIQDDPEFKENKAKRLLRNFVEKQPAAISKKTQIMLDHFIASTYNKIRGKAKAMVIARSRLHAVLYKKEFDKMILAEGYPFKTLVAYTGIIKHHEKEITENSMNNLPRSKSIRSAFDEGMYRILIVANKFQTGFDQPLLHTIYVDKQLNGITAVQSLSRANRICPPHKIDTLILDFVNDPEVIQISFQPYYETSFLSEGTDPHKLYDLEAKLMDFKIIDWNDVETFYKNYKKNVPQAKLHNIFNPIIIEFNKKNQEDKVNFKKTLKRYQNIYAFLSQLIPFADINLEKLFIFNKFLYKKLPTINDPLPFQVLQDVELDSYKIVKKGYKKISLTEEEGKVSGIADDIGKYLEEEEARLSKIIKDLNEAFGTEFTDDDRVFLQRTKDNLLRNEDLIKKIKSNSKQNVKMVFGKYFEKEMHDLLGRNQNLYKRIVDNEQLRDKVRAALFELIYSDYRKNNKK
jgi:type I restriction enzyme, R subunit